MPTKNQRRRDIISQVEFAKLCGVTKAAINKAIKAGNIFKNKDAKIPIANAKNQAYLQNQVLKKKMELNNLHARPDVKKKQGRIINQPVSEILPIDRGDHGGGNGQELVTVDKYQADVQRLLQTIEKLKISNAKELRKLIPIVEVRTLFEKQSSILISHFHPLGQRTSEKIAGAAGISDPKTIMKIEKIITDEQMKAINEFKKALIIEE